MYPAEGSGENKHQRIANQKRILSKYAKDNGFQNLITYIDDGYTGTNFYRPDFKRMMKDIENEQLSTVIVKDLSRFGRNYLEVGYYLEEYFPNNEIRFIAVNDGVDSKDGEDDFTPFRNIMNEWYAKDISRKVKSAHRAKALSGESLSKPLYGYMKSPDNPRTWVIDQEAAQIVKSIYKMSLNGMGSDQIAKHLEEEKVLTPYYYWKSKGINISGKKPNGDNPYFWRNTTIISILSKQEYVGDVINFKSYSKSFKNKKRYATDKEQLLVFKDVHELIIDRETWEIIQSHRGRSSTRKPKEVAKNIFSGLLYCADCGSKLHFKRYSSSGLEYFECSNYKGNRGSCETTHRIRVDALEQLVINEWLKFVNLYKQDEQTFVEYFLDDNCRMNE